MRAADEDALICDFAETYHIYDYRKLPPQYAAVLACGLRDDSRIKMKLAGTGGYNIDTILQAAVVDRLNAIIYDKDHRPESLVENMLPQKQENTVCFDSGEDFMKYRARFVK